MAAVALFLLGPPRLERDGVPLQFDTRKILALAAYLAVHSQDARDVAVSRDSLVALLWPELEPERAHAVLRRNLSLLNKALAGEWLLIDRHTVGIDPRAEFRLDVDEFTRLVHDGLSQEHPQNLEGDRRLADLEAAVALYQGDFLEGFSLRDSVAFDDWQFFQAEELRQELASALERLVRSHLARDNPDAALPHARRWLQLDPLHEPAHRQLMQAYAQAGQRSAALRQYGECVRILNEELGLAPAAETTALYEQIRTAPSAGERPSPVPGPASGPVPPLWTAPPCHNLPAQTTPFVGREHEISELRARLLDPGCRLLTLLGPGGVGKTRLALRLAEDLMQAGSFEHGVFLVALAPLQAAEGLVPAIADALCCSFQLEAEDAARATPRQQLLDYLRRKQLLLVMDNFEHLLTAAETPDGPPNGAAGGDAVGLLAEVLAAAPDVKILATSRTSLKLQGEHLYPLPGLRVPPGPPDRVGQEPLQGGQTVRGYSAVELFAQAARQVRPGFELRPSDETRVAHICRLVQGLPLAIILAAAWVEMLPLEEIASEIQRSLDFLEADLRDVPLRQRSIRAVFDSTWRLLDEHEQEIFQGLSVFVGGFTREAAQAVTGASLRDLLSLVAKSVVFSFSPGRYELHELLRQYAASRLDASPGCESGAAVRDRHCAHYTAALERWAAELKGSRQRQALDEMDLDIENARAAWHWAVEHGQVARLAQAMDGLWLYHTWRIRLEEGEMAFRIAAASLDTMAGAQRLWAKCLILWSDFNISLGQPQEAIDTAGRAVALLREMEAAGHDVRPEMALATATQGRIARYYYPDPLEARDLYARSVALYQEIGDRWGQARALAYWGLIVENLGDMAEAQVLCEQSLAIRQELGDRRGAADAMLNLGIICWVQGCLDEAHHLLEESLGIFRALDDWTRMAQAIKSMGEVLVRRGQTTDGLALLDCSVDIYDHLGFAFGVWGLLPFQAEARLHLGDYAQARDLAQRGVMQADQAGHHWTLAFSLLMVGLAALAQGAAGDALTSFEEAAAVFDEIRHRENRGWVLGPLALAALQAGDSDLARRSLVEALTIGIEQGTIMPLLYGLPVAALFLAAQDAVERAVEAYACVSRHEFVASSRLFADLIGKPLAASAALLPAAVAKAAQQRGCAQSWEALAARMVTELA